MAVVTRDQLVAAIAGAQSIQMQKTSITATTAAWYSLFAATGMPSAGTLNIGNTTSGIIPTDTTAGAPTITDFSGANIGYIMSAACNNGVAGCLRIYDRLWHWGSLSLTTLATTSTSSFPALTRLPASNTNGLGVELWLECQTTVSATATTVTVSYTNSDGVAARTASLDTSTNGIIANRLMQFRLQAGDRGVKSVESVTVGGTVATAGAINIVLVLNKVSINVLAAGVAEARQDAFSIGMPQVYSASCLCAMFMPNTTTTGAINYDVSIGQG